MGYAQWQNAPRYALQRPGFLRRSRVAVADDLQLPAALLQRRQDFLQPGGRAARLRLDDARGYQQAQHIAPARRNSNIEADVYDVAVLHFVVAPFQAQLAGAAQRCFAPLHRQQIGTAHHFRRG